MPRRRPHILLTLLPFLLLLLMAVPALPARSASAYEMYFPVVGANYYGNDFGAPRGDHLHQGNDIMTYVKGVPIVAVASGTVGWTSSQCCAMQLNHDDGWSSWYIHLNNDTPGTDDGQGWGFAPGVVPGAHVEAGQVIGYSGDSGNAEATAPHLHFELHDPSGAAINPYPHLNAATPAPLCMGLPADIIGTAGGDTLNGTSGDEVIIGLGGDDMIDGGGGDDVICSGDGQDVVYGGAGNDQIEGGLNSDLIMGGKGNDLIKGQRGHDTVKGGPGDDTVLGGKGEDTMSYASSASPVDADLTTGSATGEGSDSLTSIENLIGSDYGDNLTGSDEPNTLSGGIGADMIFGLASDDTLKGGKGADQIVAGPGNDVVSAGRGDDVVDGSEDDDTLYGHGGDDELTGSSGNDLGIGGPGYDGCDIETAIGCEF